ncbi:unnamed protein product, partial [Allacma fusca]
ATHIALDETTDVTKENATEIKKISKTIDKIHHDNGKRDDGSMRLVREINAIKENMRNTPHASGVKSKSLAIDAGSVKNAGISFTDDQLHFPHEFLDEFDNYFMETNALEGHKILAFKGVIQTKTRNSFLETVRNVQSYLELKSKFLDFYWDRKAQNEALKACRYEFVYSEDLKDMANKMSRWARSLIHHRHMDEEEIIDLLIGKAPEDYQVRLTRDGQSMEEFLEKLAKLTKIQRDPDNEVPIVFRRQFKRRYEDQVVPQGVRYVNKSTQTPQTQAVTPAPRTSNPNLPIPPNDQLIALWNLIKTAQPNLKTFNRTPAQTETSNYVSPTKTAPTYPTTEKPEQKTILQNPQHPKPTTTFTPPNTSPKFFNIDKSGNVTMNKFRPKTPTTTPAAPVQTVQFDPELNEYVVIDTHQDDLTDQVAMCNLLNTIFEDTESEIERESFTAALQSLMMNIPSESDEAQCSTAGNESH